MNELEQQLRHASSQAAAGPSAQVREALTSRALEEGLVDVAYAQVDSPFGPLTLAATSRGLVQLAYPEHSVDLVLEKLAARISPRLLEAPARLDSVRRELDEYFEGRREVFDVPIDWALTRGFFERILRATKKIGYGETITYRDVAARAGNPAAVRAAGNGLGSNPIPVIVPCHRVLATGGGLGGYTGGVERKQFLLALEQRRRGERPGGGA